MQKPSTPPPGGADLERLQLAFLDLLPTIVHIARVYFRFVPCPGRREDLVCEAVALAWDWHLKLAARGRDPAGFARAFARLAARAAGSGRRVCGQERTTDALADGRRRQGAVVYLPQTGGVMEEALTHNTQSPVPDQVQFRTDFAAWKHTRSDRDQGLIDLLALGHRTSDVAVICGITAGRVSQLRREYHDDYLAFLTDDPTG